MSYQATLVILGEERQIVARRMGGLLVLPEVQVESGRVGISLFRTVLEKLHLETFCLVVPKHANKGFHVLRLQVPIRVLPSDLIWIRPRQLSEPDVVESILQKVEESTNSFGGYAWYSRAAVWLQAQIHHLGYVIHGLEQWNGRIGGVLLRVLTSGPQFWFKAVSDFNAREIGIAQMLAAKHPAHFPRVIATEPASSAFLLEHVEGRELYDCDDLAHWNQAARSLADIQMEWVGTSDLLLKAGAADLRAETMAAELPKFLDHIDDVMSRQPKTPPRTLTRVDLDELGCTLYALCADVAALSLAEGLANADFSPHNTLITNRGPVFIDWAEAALSFPLITGEYLWNRMVAESPDRARWQSTLRTTYLSRWAQSYGAGTVERAMRLLPAFAIFAVAMFCHERECDGASPVDSYLRSLARGLDDAVKNLGHRSQAIRA